MSAESPRDRERYDWDREGDADAPDEHSDPPLPHAGSFVEAISTRTAREKRAERMRRGCLILFALFVLAVIIAAVLVFLHLAR